MIPPMVLTVNRRLMDIIPNTGIFIVLIFAALFVGGILGRPVCRHC